MMCEHQELLLTNGFEPHSPKETTAFMRCTLCGNPCERVIDDGMCPACEPFNNDDDHKHRRTQQRILSYFRMGLNLAVVAEGRYRCDAYPEIRVTAAGFWQVGDLKGKGLLKLRSVLKRIGYRLVKNQYLHPPVSGSADP